MTRQWLDATAEDGLRQFQAERKVKLTGDAKHRYLASFHDVKLLEQVLYVRLAFPTYDNHPEMDLKLTLDGGEQILASSRSQLSFMVPWAVSRNGKSILTYNADIGRAIARLVPPDFTNFIELNSAEIRSDVIWFVNKKN